MALLRGLFGRELGDRVLQGCRMSSNKFSGHSTLSDLLLVHTDCTVHTCAYLPPFIDEGCCRLLIDHLHCLRPIADIKTPRISLPGFCLQCQFASRGKTGAVAFYPLVTSTSQRTTDCRSLSQRHHHHHPQSPPSGALRPAPWTTAISDCLCLMVLLA